MTLPHGPGYVTQSADPTPSLLRAIGCNWVCQVWDEKPDVAYMDRLIGTYQDVFGTGVLVCTSMAKARIAGKRWKNQIIVPYNEPQDPEQQYLGPEELATVVRTLQAEGIKIGGPNVGIVPDDADYIKRFYAELTAKRAPKPAYLVNHLYKRTVSDIAPGEIISEAGPDPKIADETLRALWYLDVIRSGATVALFQAVDTGRSDGCMVNDSYASPWRLNECGKVIAAALKAAAVPPAVS